MKARQLFAFFITSLVLSMGSCNKDNDDDDIIPPPDPPGGTDTTGGNNTTSKPTKEKLTGWWSPYKNGTLNTPVNNPGYPLLYLGRDSFYMQKFLGQMQPGEWLFYSDSVSLMGVRSKVTMQNSDSVIKLTNGNFTQYYQRKDSALIVSNDPRVSTIAGSGATNFNGNNINAITANLNTPSGLAIDNNGNIYIAEYFGQRIRKINAGDGKISVIAGTGTAGFSGDNGPALNAQFTNPACLVMDASGNLLVADITNRRIRKINLTSNTITTIIGSGGGFSGDGGPSASAKISAIGGLAIDLQGNIYLSDQLNHRIRKVDASTGIISTIAGTGSTSFNGDNISATSANLNEPMGLFADASGNIIFADSKHHRIRKINAADGKISTIAGTGSPGFLGDKASALNALLNSPSDVKQDTQGDLFIADYENRRIRKITISSGIINTIAGNGQNSFADGPYASYFPIATPAALVFNGQSQLLIADKDNNRIRSLINR